MSSLLKLSNASFRFPPTHLVLFPIVVVGVHSREQRDHSSRACSSGSLLPCSDRQAQAAAAGAAVAAAARGARLLKVPRGHTDELVGRKGAVPPSDVVEARRASVALPVVRGPQEPPIALHNIGGEEREIGIDERKQNDQMRTLGRWLIYARRGIGRKRTRQKAQGRESCCSIETGYSKTSLTGGKDADRESAASNAPAQNSVSCGWGGISVR